jgi:hypothetical protein
LIEEEVVGAKSLDGGVEGVVVEEDGPQDGTLGVEVIGEGLFESGLSGSHCNISLYFRLR